MPEARRFYVYIVFRLSGIPCYVGKGEGNRWRSHISKSHNQHLRRIYALAEYPLPVVKVREKMTEQEAFETERAFISAIGREDLGCGPLVNHTDGGEGFSGGRHSAEVRTEMSAHSRAMPRTEQHRARISAALKGRKLRPLTDAERLAVSEGLKRSAAAMKHVMDLADRFRGKPLTKDHRAKIAAALRGKPFSEERKLACREGHKRRSAASLKNLRPWEKDGISESTWYRRMKAERDRAPVAA